MLAFDLELLDLDGRWGLPVSLHQAAAPVNLARLAVAGGAKLFLGAEPRFAFARHFQQAQASHYALLLLFLLRHLLLYM